MDQFTKQPAETFFVDVDFIQVLGGTELILVGSSSASALNNAEADATTDVLEVASLAVSDSKLKVRVKAGVRIDSPYKITLRAVTNEGNTWEKDIEMLVEEV